MNKFKNMDNTAMVVSEEEDLNSKIFIKGDFEFNYPFNDFKCWDRKITINKRLLKDVLKAIENKDKSEKITFYLRSATYPLIIKSETREGVIAPILEQE